jgi:hypothetical protein
MGCGSVISSGLADDQGGLCQFCQQLLEPLQATARIREQLFREEDFLDRCFLPTVDPYGFEQKLDQLISMTSSLQSALDGIHTALKRYEAHYREVHNGS